MFAHSSGVFAAMTLAIFSVQGQAHQAHVFRDCTPVTGPFYLTSVPTDGSATYPIFTAVESRGVQVLSSATSYFDQWTYNT